MRFAVLMTCHNRKDKTLECLKNLYNQTMPDEMSFDVYLVNDGCTDGTETAVKKLFPLVNIIEGKGDLFWNRGMCKAWDETRKNDSYNAVLWLNDDTMLAPNAFGEIDKITKDNPCAIVVGSISSTNDPCIVTYGGYSNKKLINPENGTMECDTFNGNCVFVPKEVSKKIGYLDPYYRHSMGDFDYSWRAVTNGIKCLVTPVIGTCDRNPPEPCWNKGSLINRFKKLYSPLGNNPLETFHFYKKYSLFKAVGYFMYIHIRVLMTFVLPKQSF